MAKTKILQANLPLGKYMEIISKGYMDIFHQKLGHLEIERYYSILVFIGNKEKCTQQHISDFLKTDKASMVRIMNYLSEHGMTDKRVNAYDRRQHFVFLTEKAKNILPEIHKAMEETNNIAMEEFSKKDIRHFYKYMDTMKGSLDTFLKNKMTSDR